jgi:hypothetical protein
MSSETSTKAAGGSRRSPSDVPAPAAAADPGFQPAHFFVLVSLLAATVAVMMARPNAPENLILISLTIGAAGIAALCLYRVLAPLVAPHTHFDRQLLSDRMRVDLEREKALTLRSIKELEFDRAMGKVSPQDFDEMAGRLRARALGLMRQLDAGVTPYRAVIEKELAALASTPAAAPPPADAPCACGTRNDRDARFCKGCGARLTPA